MRLPLVNCCTRHALVNFCSRHFFFPSSFVYSARIKVRLSIRDTRQRDTRHALNIFRTLFVLFRESNRLIFPVQVRFGFNSGFKFRFSSG